MKLELKHLSPYLPHKLKVADNITMKPRVMNTGQGASTNWVGIKTILNYQDNEKYFYRPILRPLSDFNYRDYWGYPNKEMFYEDVKNKTIVVKLLEELLEDHIDIFGLIEKGLAIDINDLKH